MVIHSCLISCNKTMIWSSCLSDFSANEEWLNSSDLVTDQSFLSFCTTSCKDSIPFLILDVPSEKGARFHSIENKLCYTYGVRNWYWHPWDPACHVLKQCTCLTDLPKSRIVIVMEHLCSYLTPLLLDGLAGVRKLAFELPFPNAGVEGGLLVLMRGP